MSEPREQDVQEEDFVWVTPIPAQLHPELFTCPTCGALPFDDCIGVNAPPGYPWGSHLKRHSLADDMRGMR